MYILHTYTASVHAGGFSPICLKVVAITLSSTTNFLATDLLEQFPTTKGGLQVQVKPSLRTPSLSQSALGSQG